MTIRSLLRCLLANPSRAMLLAAACVVSQGCGPDMGPPPDQNAKNNPPTPPKQPTVKAGRGGASLKVKSIKP